MVLHHSADGIVRTAVSGLAAVFQIPDAPWMRDAVCAQTDPEAFFPTKGQNVHTAKALCASCPASEQCLEYALEIESGQFGVATSYGPWGVYGGKSPRERLAIIRERRAGAES